MKNAHHKMLQKFQEDIFVDTDIFDTFTKESFGTDLNPPLAFGNNKIRPFSCIIAG
jgi:hypothetical protein